jgi:hypothetical protein
VAAPIKRPRPCDECGEVIVGWKAMKEHVSVVHRGCPYNISKVPCESGPCDMEWPHVCAGHARMLREMLGAA